MVQAPSGPRRGNPTKARDEARAKETVLDWLSKGRSVRQALQKADRTQSTWERWRRDDLAFRQKADAYRGLIAISSNEELVQQDRPQLPPFPEFSRKYLNKALGPHHLRMLDVIEGREPRDLHPSMTYQRGREDRVLFNVPPDHAKSTTFTVNYVLYRLLQNPMLRVAIVSKTESMAINFLMQIKNYLTSPQWSQMHNDFGPADGWRDETLPWTADEVYLRGRQSSPEKDPSVQALGWGGQIYGARLDLLIFDDIIDMASAKNWEAQKAKIGLEYLSRLPPDEGLCITVGTRMAPIDIYKELRDMTDVFTGERIWNYLSQPAVLEEADPRDPKTWLTLWPEREDGKGVKRPGWTGPALGRRRAEMQNERVWLFAYQQADVSDMAAFRKEALAASVRIGDRSGPVDRSGDIRIVAGLDPATTGHTAAVVQAVSRQTGHRRVLDAWDKPNAQPDQIIGLMKVWQERYGIQEWIVERNAFQRFLTRLPELKQFIHAHGGVIKEHWTGQNKADENFGVAAMASLFESNGYLDDETGLWVGEWEKGDLSLPDPKYCPAVATLLKQLEAWQPDPPKGQLTDLVMALWFCQIGSTPYLATSTLDRLKSKRSPYVPRRDWEGAGRIDIASRKRPLGA